MTEVTPHPKPDRRKGNRPRRIIDPAAVGRARRAHPECAACGVTGENGHHVLPKDKGGDDVEANIVSLCGSGTSRCHGATHGSAYVVEQRDYSGERPSLLAKPSTWRERRDAEWVNRRIGEHLLMYRPDVVAYVLGKMGDVAGRDFLRRAYRVVASVP